jgi:hypothetical protein
MHNRFLHLVQENHHQILKPKRPAVAPCYSLLYTLPPHALQWIPAQQHRSPLLELYSNSLHLTFLRQKGMTTKRVEGSEWSALDNILQVHVTGASHGKVRNKSCRYGPSAPRPTLWCAFHRSVACAVQYHSRVPESEVSHAPQLKSAEYEKPLNSSCIA